MKRQVDAYRAVTRSLRWLILPPLLACAFAALPQAARCETTGLPANIEALYNSGHYREAVQPLETAIAAQPQNASLPYWLGRCFYELGDFNTAIPNFEKAIVLDPNRSDFHDWLARACGRKAEQSSRFSAFSALPLARRAGREFALAVTLDPKNIEAQRDEIRYLLNAPGIAGGSQERAEQQIQALSEVDPVEADLARAESFVLHKQFDQADEEYQKVLQVPPHRVGVCFEIAEYYRDHGEPERMQQAVDAAAKIDGSDLQLDYYRGVALVMEQKDLGQAEKDLLAYIASVPDSAEAPAHSSAYEWLGKLYEDQKRFDQAATAYQNALGLDSRSKVAREGLKRLKKE